MQRSYTYYDLTISICSNCLVRTPAKIIFRDDRVYLRKHCAEHGVEEVLISDDIAYFLRCRSYVKPSEMPMQWQTPIKAGCPYDCGLCPDHEQHFCLTIIEVTDRCNLQCPTCYAGSGPTVGRHRSLAEIEQMLDNVVASEGEPDVIQISGGEPTIHPDFFAILDAAKARPIKHLMLNTNGLRLAREPEFVAQLASYKENFEVYLQFDSLREGPIKTLRGVALSDVRRRALDHLNEHDISTTLVATVRRDLNDDELGAILEFAVEQPCVRGVTFQPVQFAGRNDAGQSSTERLSLSAVRRKILQQTDLFNADDLIPVPCNPDYLCMAYGLKGRGAFQPLTRHIDPGSLLDETANTIIFERDPALRQTAMKMLSTGASSESASGHLRQLLCCLPMIRDSADLSYRNVFRVIIMEFMDAFNFDVRGIKKSCVHIAHPDGRIIPFETMNLFYREGCGVDLDALNARHIGSLS
ncbi:radical SAM protein [Cerasicoccus frondis]|uniref:radical SAM protein n=1 Tax=Cerasicoccus frondis TaxID=490090 RepID=UPI002852D6E5|nr:radical SAM protein [Cerasicoccus frondis]